MTHPDPEITDHQRDVLALVACALDGDGTGWRAVLLAGADEDEMTLRESRAMYLAAVAAEWLAWILQDNGEDAGWLRDRAGLG
jgi:hypothetical protein